MEKLKTFAPIFLRISMSLVILWFGVEQIIDAPSWLGFLPSWTTALPLSQITLVHVNGIFEIVFGTFLLLGFYTRIVALLLALHLFDIAYIVGYDAIGIRDLGLALSTTAIFLYGADTFSFDTILL
jgi:uncharacterized membrane protein YphA (DoxX/SURF4 family)